ncbi:MAG TPA: hypothetical protein VGM65_07585 [Candidatus Udaeobacter sp.]
MLRTFLIIGVFALTATASRGDSELVVAVRYLQAKATSHSHLYLYREDGKLLRQLTNDNSGQDSDPIFASDGETIVFTREKPDGTHEFWSIDPLGKKLVKLTAAPDWYSGAKSSPAFTSSEDEESPESTPTSPPEQSASPSATVENVQQNQHQSTTALDAVADAADRPPQPIKAPDGSGEIFWRKGKEGEGPEEPLNWIMWFRDLKSGQEKEIGRLPAFPSFEPLQVHRGKDGRGPSDVDGQRESVGERELDNQFLFDGSARFVFFSTHLDSQSGSTVMAFDFNKRKLIRLSPNWATPIPLPGEAAFLTLTENRYVQIPGTTKTAICFYLERWGADIKEDCLEKRWAAEIQQELFEDESWHGLELEHPICAGEPEVRYTRKNSAALFYGASMYRPGKNPAVIIVRNGAD